MKYKEFLDLINDNGTYWMKKYNAYLKLHFSDKLGKDIVTLRLEDKNHSLVCVGENEKETTNFVRFITTCLMKDINPRNLQIDIVTGAMLDELNEKLEEPLWRAPHITFKETDETINIIVELENIRDELTRTKDYCLSKGFKSVSEFNANTSFGEIPRKVVILHKIMDYIREESNKDHKQIASNILGQILELCEECSCHIIFVENTANDITLDDEDKETTLFSLSNISHKICFKCNEVSSKKLLGTDVATTLKDESNNFYTKINGEWLDTVTVPCISEEEVSSIIQNCTKCN